MKAIAQVITGSVAAGVLFLMIGAYLDRATVEVSVNTGYCVRAYGPSGSIACKDALKMSHEIIFVSPRKNKKITEG